MVSGKIEINSNYSFHEIKINIDANDNFNEVNYEVYAKNIELINILLWKIFILKEKLKIIMIFTIIFFIFLIFVLLNNIINYFLILNLFFYKLKFFMIKWY